MPTPQPFLQLVINRAHAALQRLDAQIWESIGALPTEATPCFRHPLSLQEATNQTLQPLETAEHWGKLYDFRWFRVVVPPGATGEMRYLKWEDQSQGCAWLDGMPYHGFDYAQRYCPISEAGGEFWIESTCLSPFIGPWIELSPDGTRCLGASLHRRNDTVWSAFHGLQVLYDLAVEERRRIHPEMGKEPRLIGYQPELPSVPPLYRRVLRRIDECVTAYDTGGAQALESALARAYEMLRDDGSQTMRSTLIGHAHIDLVWLWPERIGDFKAQHTFATVNRLMESYPELRFLHSQTASYRAVEKRAPTLMSAVRQRISEGRWEATGAMEVESDTLLACGEGLARSFLLGQERFAALTGSPSRVLWLPDVFGYTGCLPQLMRAFGVDYFFTTKLSWNALNRFPDSSFRWRGQDGTSEVIAHLTQDIGYNSSVGLDDLRLGESSYRQSDVHGEFLVPTGYGDGGGAPTAEMCERARRLENLAGAPKVAWGAATSFFDRLAEVRDDLPVHEGELYFEYHRGTYTTQCAVKLAFREAERALQAAEAVHVVRGLGRIEERWWERVVFAQFHDYITGTSVPPVFQEALVDLAAVCGDALAAASAALDGDGGGDCLFNPLPHPVVVNRGDKLMRIPPLAGCRVDDAALVEDAAPVTVSAERLSNGIVEALVDADGRLTELRIRGRSVALAEGAGQMWVYDDRPALFESWDIDRQTLDTGRPVDGPAEILVERRPDGAGVIAVLRKVGAKSTVAVRFILRQGRDVVEFELDCDWQEENAMLKIQFPTRYGGQMARYGAPFGSVRRSDRLTGRG